MNTELDSLEKKVSQLLRLYQDAQLENDRLRQQLSASDTENIKLNEKINVAAERLEKLLAKIPERKK